MHNLIKTVVVEILLQLSMLFCFICPILYVRVLYSHSRQLLPRFLCKNVYLKLKDTMKAYFCNCHTLF